MRLPDHCSPNAGQFQPGIKSGFTLVEALIAVGILALVVASAMPFIYFSARAISGVAAQVVINQKAGNAIEFMQSRIRFATSIAVDSTGNILTLGFDQDYNTDSDHDGIAYNDKDYFERFQFFSNNSTNSTACSTNKLVYYPNYTSSPNTSQTLISSGVRNLPGYKIFSVTNTVIVVIRYGIVDSYAGDHYQAVDIQGTGVSLNRPFTNNILGIF